MARLKIVPTVNENGFFNGTTIVQEDPTEPGKYLMPTDAIDTTIPENIEEYFYKIKQDLTWEQIKREVKQDLAEDNNEKDEPQSIEQDLSVYCVKFKNKYFEVSAASVLALQCYLQRADFTNTAFRCYEDRLLSKDTVLSLKLQDIQKLSKLLEDALIANYVKLKTVKSSN